MANQIVLKRSAVADKVPTTSDLALGELAVNTSDGRLYTKRDNGTAEIVEFLNTEAAFKPDVIVATTANITLSGTQTIDAIGVTAGMRVLVKNQTAPAENGVYIVSAGAWTRATDMDTSVSCAGAVVAVMWGAVNGGQLFTTTFKTSQTVGTSAMNWYQVFDASQTLSAANGGTGETSLPAAMAGLQGLQSITSSAGTTTLTASSPRTIHVTGSTTHTIVLPAVSTLKLGWVFEIVNANSNGAVTVQSSGLNAFATTLGAGNVCEFVCISTSGTGTASWQQKFTGGVSRSGNGSNMVYSIAPLLNQINLTSANAVTAGTNAQGQGALTETVNLITTATSNPSGVTLPAAVGATQSRWVTIINKGANPVNVYPSSGYAIDALGLNNPISLPVGGVMSFFSTSTSQWYTTANLFAAFTSSAAGLVPASGGGTTNFLRADGTWAAPPAGGSVAWGSITGTLSSQTDLQGALDAKAGLTANSFSGNQTVTGTVTSTDGTVSTRMATSTVAYYGTTTNHLVVWHTNNIERLRINTDDTIRMISTDAGATALPVFDLFRDSASPAAADALGMVKFTGRDSGAGLQEYANIFTRVLSPTAAAETGEIVFSTVNAGVVNDRVRIGPDGVVRTEQNASANEGVVVSRHWMALTVDYTLTSVATEQKAFNTTTNGALTLPTGVYEFECLLYVTTMSATSGNLAFDPVGAGTAVTDRWGYATWGLDNTTPTTAAAIGGAVNVAQQTGANAVTAGTGTGMWMRASGMFRVTTAGTIIPSVTLQTANAAVMKAGSWFKCAKIGETTETFVGAWT